MGRDGYFENNILKRNVIAVSTPKMDGSERYTYSDYITWPDNERFELIDGVPYLLASATPEHQEVSAQLHASFVVYLQNKECRAYAAPTDVTFEVDMNTRQTVQPDLFVMCGRYEREKRIIGVPVLVIEILSPSSAKHDLIRKMTLYQRVHVKEYWVVDPEDKLINVYLHDGLGLRWSAAYAVDDNITPSMFKDLLIDVGTVFERQ